MRVLETDTAGLTVVAYNQISRHHYCYRRCASKGSVDRQAINVSTPYDLLKHLPIGIRQK